MRSRVKYIFENDRVWNSRMQMPMCCWRAFSLIKILKQQKLKLVSYIEIVNKEEKGQMLYDRKCRSLNYFPLDKKRKITHDWARCKSNIYKAAIIAEPISRVEVVFEIQDKL